MTKVIVTETTTLTFEAHVPDGAVPRLKELIALYPEGVITTELNLSPRKDWQPQSTTHALTITKVG